MAATMPALSSDPIVALKRLRLGRIADTLPDRLVLDDKQDMSFDELLIMILTDEISRRDGAAADNRATQAGLDPSMHLERWDKEAKVSFDRKILAELVSLRFLETHRHVCILGPVGVGKTLPVGWPRDTAKDRPEALFDLRISPGGRFVRFEAVFVQVVRSVSPAPRPCEGVAP